MFEYKEDKNLKILSIIINSDIIYDVDFLKDVSKMMEIVENSPCSRVHFSFGEKFSNIDDVAAGFLYNVMSYLNHDETKDLYLEDSLASIFARKRAFRTKKKFEKIDALKTLKGEKDKNYFIDNETKVGETVERIVEFIVENNITNDIIKEILITTIGEIFSNAFTHSNEDSVSFIYNIDRDDKFFLLVSITDFGKTIIKNVSEYLINHGCHDTSSDKCLEWAMKKGNTTREKSGGFGLPMLAEYMKKADGELGILSGNSYYIMKNGIEQISILESSFCGTSVFMKIPILDTSKAIQYDKEKKEIISVNLGEL